MTTKQAFTNLIYEFKYLGITITPEFKFCKDRKFRADFMLEKDGKLVLVEYEGIFGSNKSRHTGVKGFTTDTEKYNLASKLGFQLLRYTAKNYKDITKDVCEIFNINN